MRINNDDLLLPPDDDSDDYKATEQKSKKRVVKFNTNYNENEDEKKLEDNPTSYNDPVISKNSNVSLTERRLNKCRENVSAIQNVPKSKRTPQQVLDLWTAGFNLHDLAILEECYSPQVTSQQFVNQKLSAREPVLQWCVDYFTHMNAHNIFGMFSALNKCLKRRTMWDLKLRIVL